jgi:hypothetical protein
MNDPNSNSNRDLPLSQPWERIAAKELGDLSHYVAHGLFINPADLAERLRLAADKLEQAADRTEN